MTTSSPTTTVLSITKPGASRTTTPEDQGPVHGPLGIASDCASLVHARLRAPAQRATDGESSRTDSTGGVRPRHPRRFVVGPGGCQTQEAGSPTGSNPRFPPLKGRAS